MNTTAAYLDELLRNLATKKATMPWVTSNDATIDSGEIGTISEDEQKALDAFYKKYTLISFAVADDAADASAIAADDTASAIVAADASAIAADDASAIVAAVVKVQRKKKILELFHDGINIEEPCKNGDAVDISATYTVHKLLSDGEYKTEHKSTSINFRKYKNLKKRSKEVYIAKDSTIHNYGMVKKVGCPCNFTRVVKAILEHPNHLFKNGAPIPENLTILYYDNNI